MSLLGNLTVTCKVIHSDTLIYNLSEFAYDIDKLYVIESRTSNNKDSVIKYHESKCGIYNLPVSTVEMSDWLSGTITIDYVYSILNKEPLRDIIYSTLGKGNIDDSSIEDISYGSVKTSNFMSAYNRTNKFYSFAGEEKTSVNFNLIESLSVVILETLITGNDHFVYLYHNMPRYVSGGTFSSTILINEVLRSLIHGIQDIITLKFIKEYFSSCHIPENITTVGFLIEGAIDINKTKRANAVSKKMCHAVNDYLIQLFNTNLHNMNQELLVQNITIN